MKSRFLLAGLLTLAGFAQAVPYYGPGPNYGPGPMSGRMGPAMSAESQAPVMALRTGVDKLLEFLSAEPRPDEAALAAFLNDEIAPFFDFDFMAKSAGGRLFARLGEEQQAEMTAQIKQSFLAKMAEKLGGYSDQQVRFLPPRGGQSGRTMTVSAAIMNPGTYPARMDFRLYRSGDKWRVYDVAANGQSAIVHYRRELMRQIQQQKMQQMRQQPRQMQPGRMGGPMGRPMPPGMMMAPPPAR